MTKLIQIEQMARDFVAPDDACRSWRALYAGAAKFVNDLREHIHIENNIAFPRSVELESKALASLGA